MSEIGLGRVKVEGTGSLGMGPETRARLETLAADLNKELVILKQAAQAVVERHAIADDAELTKAVDALKKLL